MTDPMAFYHELTASNRSFKERLEQKLLSAKDIVADEEAGAPSDDGSVFVRLGGDFRIIGLQIHEQAWEDEAITEESLARAVVSAYSEARKSVYNKYRDKILEHFGLD